MGFLEGLLLGDMLFGDKTFAMQKIANYVQYGDNKLEFGEYSAALLAFEQARALAQTENSKRFRNVESSILLKIGYTYIQLKQFDKTLIAFEQGLKLAKQQKDTSQQAIFLNAIGGIYLYVFNEYQDALKFFNEALGLKFVWKDGPLKIEILKNAGHCYQKLEKYEAARDCYEQGLKITKMRRFEEDNEKELNELIAALPNK
jgi:tetratricopeptide (TPR) repeat protein